MKLPKLKASTYKQILSLESHYPDKNKDIWVTINEMRDRLVHSGVHNSLSLELLEYALTRCNSGSVFVTKRTDGRTSFYRDSSLTHDVGAPLDQRNRLSSRYAKRLPINPERDYLKTHHLVRRKLEMINSALLRYADDMDEYNREQIKEQKKKEAFDAAVEKAVAEKLKESRDNTNTNNNLTNNNEAREVTPPRATIDSSSIKGNNSNGIYSIPMMTKFIAEATKHASECGTSINLNEVDKKYGAGIIQKWECPKCGKELELRNCNWVRTSVVEEGRRESRKQPELNLKIAIGTRTCGINMEKMHAFVSGSMGVKMSSRNNARHTDRKIRQSIGEVFKVRKEENLAEHVAACKQLPGNTPLPFEYNGVKSEATFGTVSQDGGGKKRAYRQNINGDEAGLVVHSEVTGRPINITHHQVSDMICYDMCMILFSLCLTQLLSPIITNYRTNATNAHVLQI